MLLPAEIELCETVGITEDEYFYFVELTQAYNGKRPKEYDELPYVVNFQALGILTAKGALTTFGQFLLGVILNVVSVLLAPKPRAPKTPPSLTTAGQTGPKRFAPQTGFNSIQELANFGEIVPLIFTKQEITKSKNYIQVNGGVRVNTRLLWSQMISLGSSQQLKALFMLGLGTLAAKPDFAGYAIGDLLLENYINKKIALYMRPDGGRPKETHKYDEGTLGRQKDRNGSIMHDVMSVDWDMGEGKNGDPGKSKSIVSSARTPNTQVQFGAFSPMPNAVRYRVPYELVLRQKDLSEENNKDIDTKRRKLRTNFPRYASIFRYHNSTAAKNSLPVIENRLIQYKITAIDVEKEFKAEKDEDGKDKSTFDPWGVDDVKSAVDTSREEADDAIQIGESYLIGSAIAICERKSRAIWSSGKSQVCTFRVDTPGVIDLQADAKRPFACFDKLAIQKCSIGTISNSKACHVTEIGLKSKVFKQVTSFPNVNSHPGAVGTNDVNEDTTEGVQKRYQDDRGSISLGGMSKYLMRYSFFRLQARVAGVGDIDWNYIDKGEPFAIKGNSPQPQYNFIRINHNNSKDKEFEFRFIPFPGNLIKRNFVDKNKTVRILNASGDLESYRTTKGDQIYEVFYKGSDDQLRSGDVSNTEWYLGALPTEKKKGKVNDLLRKSTGVIPRETRWVPIEVRSSNMDAAFHGEGRVHRKTVGSLGTNWQWGDKVEADHWKEYKSYTDTDKVLLQPDSKKGTVCIIRNGFKYCNGDFIQTRVSKPNHKKGHYFGMIKYQFKEANVKPEVYKNYAVNGGSGSGLTITLRVYRDPDTNQFKAAKWTIKRRGKNYKDTDKVSIPKTGNAASDFPGLENIDIATDFSDFVTQPWPAGKNLNPFDAIADYYQYDAERSSHQDGPEHEIVYVNEQSSLGEESPVPYKFDQPKVGIANVALRLSSSREWNSFSQLSVYIKKGLEVERLINDKGNTVTDNNKGQHGVSTKGLGPTNNFAEIVYALLTDKKFGLADSIGLPSVEKERMITAAKFCEANGFYWDGVITDKQNIREFIYQNAVFNLLDFTILGGKFSLFPSVPFNPNSFKIQKKQKPTVKALFTDGNTRNLKVSFLSPEERQNFIGTVYFRQEVENGFPETESISLHVADEENPAKLPIEIFDMSDFCTNKDHAREFLQHVLKIREKVDHGIKFETTPQVIFGLKPGDYIRFISEATHTTRFENGVISPDGIVQSVGNNSINNAQIYHWKPGTQEVKTATLKVNNGKTDQSNLYGSVFTVKQTTESNRLYKIESLAYTDEGLIDVGASHAPLLDDGTLATINYNDEDDFQGV
mgnify:FL=1